MSKKVWFSLPVDSSPDNSTAEESPVFQYREFSKLKEDSLSTEGSDLSEYSFKQTTDTSDLSQHSFKSHQERSTLSTAGFVRYSLTSRMEKNTTGETVSTNDSQDNSSQQESTVSDGLYCYEDENESSSLRDSPHEEVVNSAIMEVSGELMLGKLTPNKHPSVCSESSDISDDDIRHRVPGGAIAKYPESSTGLSDNDWNPYATESDTNQTPRSPRSTTSEDNRVGFISKANIDVRAASEREHASQSSTGLVLESKRIGISQGLAVNDQISPEQSRSDNEDIKEYATMLSEREDMERESPDTAPDTARSAYTEESRSGRQSSDSLRSEEYKYVQSEQGSARTSLETGPLDSYRRISTESAKSMSQESADNSSQPSVETVRNVRGSHSDLDRGELNSTGRLSVDSYQSQRSDRSKGNDQLEQGHKSLPTPMGLQFDRSDRLDRLSHAAGDNLKELMQFESAQRSNSDRTGERDGRLNRGRMNYPVSSTRLTARVERSPERNSQGYITIAERERLLADSPDHSKPLNPVERRSFELDGNTVSQRSKPVHSETKLPRVSDEGFGRSPSEVSMRRVSSLFEETKRQVREAVALPRPDPSGSEERFPLRERLSLNQHDDSLIRQAGNHSGELDNKSGEKLEKSRESEAARSLTSEEVARVLSKYSDYEKENSPQLNGDVDLDSRVKVSAFDSVDRGQNGHVNGTGTAGSDDELSQRVKAILADTNKLDNQRNIRDTQSSELDYIPNTIDYTRLHRDLEEIQDSLHDIPKTKANDSLPLHLRNGTTYQDSPIPPEFVIKSMETTASAMTKSLESGISEYNGRESSASEYGRRLVWDHGADLQYDNDYDGKFLGTNTSTETLSHGRKKFGYEESDTLVVRPDSVATNATDNDVLDLDSDGARTLTGSDITRAERIVQQVMNRQAEGDLKENVEDIIARYRDERRDLDGRFQAGGDGMVQNGGDSALSTLTERRKPDMVPTAVPRYEQPQPPIQTSARDKTEVGLAERVYKILTAESDNPFDRPDEQGDRSMVSTVSNILAKGRPQEQVNGILTETLTQENEMLKKIASREATKMTDSSLDDSGVNDTEDSYALEDEDIRKRLQWSQMSSPEKGDKSYMSDLKALREVTTAPYSSLSNAKSLLSTQLKKMSERNFDKSVEMRTPFRQTIQCWPVHGIERTGDHAGDVREAWMPRSGTEQLDKEKKPLGSDRFYITEKDDPTDMRRGRTYSDPFDVSHNRHVSDRDPHARSRSEEATDVHDLSQYSMLPHQYSPSHRRTASSPTSRRPLDNEFMTPKAHKPEAESWSYEYYTTSLSDSSDPRNFSDSSGCHANRSRFHSYNGPDKIRDPDNDRHIYDRFQRSSPIKSNVNTFRSQSLDRNTVNKSPVKMFKEIPERKSRSETRQKSFNVKFTTPETKFDVGPRNISEFSERQLINRISRRNDDVYDLLTDRGQGQSRLDVQELKVRLNDLQQERANSQKLSMSKSNYGNGRQVDIPTLRTKKPVYMRSRHARPVISPTDSDTSGSKRAARPRPYRPAGSRDMYYTESGDDTNESGTTIESTHPGSDDAVPPYIPRQYLGSRLEDPNRHPMGIYGVNNNKGDDLSTIDEQSAKDEKEKALSASPGSQKEEKNNRDERQDTRNENNSKAQSNTQLAETGYQTGSNAGLPDPRNLETGNLPRSRSSSQTDLDKVNPRDSSSGEKFALKSREEYLREFEEREKERRLRYAVDHRDPMGTSVRSDPGSTLEDLGPQWEYRESADRNEFKVMEPEPGYPQDRLRYSRSRSDTDLAALSPAESQRYSSPMQPGTRFMELSTQPSPIYHQDSLTIASRVRASRDMGQEQQYTPVRYQPAELPRVEDRQPTPELPRHRAEDRQPTPELPRVDDRRSSPSSIGRREPVRPLEPGEEPMRPLEARSIGHPRPQEMMEPVDLGADPRRLGDVPRSRRPRTPIYEKQKEMEAELVKMNKELSEQVKELQEGNKVDKTPEDKVPLSKKAQVLREVLENEYVEGIPPNINDMWTRFQEKFVEQSVSESSLNSTRLDALSGLIQNPTHHLVNSFLREKQQESEVQKKACEENAERIREERKKESERLKRMSEIRSAEERSERRREMKQKHGLSEEESNGSITELLMENEKKKERSKKKDKRSEDAGSPKKRKTPERERKSKKGQVDKETETQIKSRARVSKTAHSDSMDTLFSIPEDASFEQSPTKSESELRSRQRRQRHVIDPLMKKLRDKIKLQRVKIDKERRKELQRVEKLKKLEMLLNAKRGNQLSDKAIDVELQNVSSTTSVNSETTLMSTDSTINTLMSSSHGSDQSSDMSTTLKDSTGTPIKLQVKRYPELEQGKSKRHYYDNDSTESSDFSNIIVEKLPTSKADRRKMDRKSGSKERRVKLDENGQKVRKEKRSSKKKNEVFGVEVSDEDLDRQVKRYERYVSPHRTRQGRTDEDIQRQIKKNVRCVSPQRHKQLRDASTMYPSPITVSPPQRRRMRDVLMRSEAVQTSPSIRSTSPTHSYDEVPVAPVPTMSSVRSGNRSLRRRPSPSPPRSTNTRSAVTSPPRRTSRSPPARKSSRSPARAVVSVAPPKETSRQRKEPAMWKPESETPPPENSMFTPETGENTKPSSRDEATSWFIPMKPSQPWRQPLKERQAFSVRQENWKPTSVSQKQWKKINFNGVPKDQGDPNDVSRDTKFDLDPEGQPIDLESGDDSDYDDLDLSNSKPLSKMSLQEAFALRKQMTISNLRRRQKRLNFAAEERKMEAYLKMERDQLFTEERKKEANPEAHPYSDNLYKPARRVISKEEMKELTVKRYKKLPEVIEKQKQKKKEDEYSLNRIKARLFNRKVQKQVLVKAEKWGR